MNRVIKWSDEIIPIILIYNINNKIIIRSEKVDGFILKYKFPYRFPLNEPLYKRHKPITIILPKKIENIPYFEHAFFEYRLHINFKKLKGLGIIYE